MDKRRLDFLFEGHTEGLFRYLEIDTGAPMAIGMIYVRKYVFDGRPPSRIVMTIEAGIEEETTSTV